MLIEHLRIGRFATASYQRVAQTGNTPGRLSWASRFRSVNIDPCGTGADSPATSAFQAESTDPRQLERWHRSIDADIEAQDVQLEPLVDGGEKAGKAVERN